MVKFQRNLKVKNISKIIDYLVTLDWKYNITDVDEVYNVFFGNIITGVN